jgi:hypothetical protein
MHFSAATAATRATVAHGPTPHSRLRDDLRHRKPAHKVVHSRVYIQAGVAEGEPALGRGCKQRAMKETSQTGPDEGNTNANWRVGAHTPRGCRVMPAIACRGSPGAGALGRVGLESARDTESARGLPQRALRSHSQGDSVHTHTCAVDARYGGSSCADKEKRKYAVGPHPNGRPGEFCIGCPSKGPRLPTRSFRSRESGF